MIITLTGENSFGLQQALHDITHAFVAKYSDLAVERLDGETVEISRLEEALTSLPFLSARKMVILQSPSKNKAFTDKSEQIFSSTPETTEVIVVEPKLDKRLSYFKYLKKQTDFKEYPELDQQALARWLCDTAETKQGKLSRADARYLVERVGSNQQLLSNELEKLLLYSSTITRQTIDLLTDETPQSTIFQLLEAAFAGKTKQALELYQEQRALKVEPQQIIAMLSWQLHILAVIKTAGSTPVDQIARDAKLNPFVVRKSQGLTRNLSLQDLRSRIQELLVIDTKSKRTNLDVDEALQNYLVQVAL